jgi:trehalose 6-phosphate synthase/phosphatase
MKRLFIISNRLPVTLQKKRGSFEFHQSTGGLATGIKAFYRDYDCVWIGWPGVTAEKLSEADRDVIQKNLKTEFNCIPVHLTHTEYERFYLGFCNKVIWPVYHYFTEYLTYDESMWEAYYAVNLKYRDAVLKTATENDILWIHDYQLLLLPGLLRDQLPDITIGFFLHIPFPSFEVFRLLPWRKEMLQGLMGADVVGFHTYDYMRHFLSSVHRLLGYEHNLGEIAHTNRTVKVDVFPMGIDYERFSTAGKRPEVQKEVRKYRKQLGDRTIILSIDRLDYTKGIPQRLQAFQTLLRRKPEYREKVVLIMVAVPSRTRVEHYQLLKESVDQLVGQINGEHGTVGWVPVWYLYRSLDFASLAALYEIANVAMVSPLRDGMNLVAKEFVASKVDGKGVLILSEMAGAAKEMGEAIIMNPYNKERIVQALEQALTMSDDEKIARNRSMQKRLQKYNVTRWGEEFIGKLMKAREQAGRMKTKLLSPSMRETLSKDYGAAKQRLLLLDYDGTLKGFVAKPEEARPDLRVLDILGKLSADPANCAAIISGRDRKTLDTWFGDLPLFMVAEHGAWIKDPNWHTIEPLVATWKKEIRPILEAYCDRTPGSLIEEKEYSLVWHYRAADLELALMRARELTDDLVDFTANLNLDVLKGSKVVEIKNVGVNKGRAAAKLIGDTEWDFMLAVGDDWTDEDTFKIVPESCYSIKVGLEPTAAKYNLHEPNHVLELLEILSQ